MNGVEYSATWSTPAMLRQLQSMQMLCWGMVLVLTVIAVGFTAVVWLALDGQALAGNLFQIAGFPLPTLMVAVLTPLVPVVTVVVSRLQVKRKHNAIAKTHPELIDPSTDAKRLMETFALKTYIEYAIPVGVAFAWAIVYHIVCDTWILGFIAALLIWAMLKYPSWGRFDRWMKWASQQIQTIRQQPRSHS